MTAEFRQRCVVDVEAKATASGAGWKWRAGAATAGTFSAEESADAASALAGDDFLRVRAHVNGSGSAPVVGAARMVRPLPPAVAAGAPPRWACRMAG